MSAKSMQDLLSYNNSDRNLPLVLLLLLPLLLLPLPPPLPLIPLFCDFMHFKNHVNSGTDEHSVYCRTKADPALHEVTRLCNTEAAEQLFSWMKKFKFQVHHMSPGRFFLYLLAMAGRYNSTQVRENREGSAFAKRCAKKEEEEIKGRRTDCTNPRCCPAAAAAAAAQERR